MPEPLNAEQVIAICQRLRDQVDFQTWRNRNDVRQDLIYSDYPVDIKGLSQQLENRSPALRHHITEYVDALHGAELDVAVAARSADTPDIDSAQRVENYYRAGYNDLTRPTGENADRGSVYNQVAYGCGVIRQDFADFVLEDVFSGTSSIKDNDAFVKALAQTKFNKNPFQIILPDRDAVFWEPDRMTFAELGLRKISELALEYGDRTDIPGWLTTPTLEESESTYLNTVRTFHLETREFIYDALAMSDRDGNAQGEGWMLDYRANLIGRPWYTLMPGRETAEVEVNYRFDPLVGPLYIVIQNLNVLSTLINSGALQTGRNTYQLVENTSRGLPDFASFMATDPDQRPVLHTLSDDAVQRPPAGYHYEPLPVPDQQQLLNAWQIENQNLKDWGFPSVLSTETPIEGSSTSGFHASQQMQAASKALKPALRNRASAWRELFQMQADAIQALGMDVRIPVQLRAQGETTKVQQTIIIKPEDFKEHNLEVSFESVSESVEFQKRESDLRLVTAGLMPKDTFLERHYPNPAHQKELLILQRAEEPVTQMAVDAAVALIRREAPALAEEVATEARVPLGPEGAPAEGGAAPGEATRQERPPVPQGGLGAPPVPPPQAQGGVPPGVPEARGVA